MDRESQRNLQVLEAVVGDPRVTQRKLAARLGIALGLTNLYVRRLARKGYIKCVNVKRNRIRYLITPTGIAEKARLTYEFVQYSMKLYGQARDHLREVLSPHVTRGCRRFAIYGIGEPAELAYISLRELGVEPIAIFADAPDGPFLGMLVQPLVDARTTECDVIIVATFDNPAAAAARIVAAGVPKEKLSTLRPLDSLAHVAPRPVRAVIVPERGRIRRVSSQ